MQTSETIRQKVNFSPGGEVFFISDFSTEGNDAYVSRFLSEMVAEEKLGRLGNGVYYKPVMTRFGELRPTVETVVQAIARRDKAQVMPTGPSSENLLGLSTQVPMRYVYLTTGSARCVCIGKTEVTFKHCVPKNFAYKSPFMSVLVQAMKSIGRDNLTDEQRLRIAELLAKYADPSTFAEDLKLAPMWIRKTLLELLKTSQNL